MRAVFYSRVSTEEQSEHGHSIDEQNERNIDYIDREKWTLVGRFIDPGYSAKDLKRPDMGRLLSEVENENIDVIVVHKLDRLTRNIGDLYDLLKLFEKHNVKFVSVTENLDTSTAMGRMIVFLLGILAQWYRENLSEEVKKGMSGRAKKGLHNVTVPMFGYFRGEGGELKIKHDEAKWVKWIFDQYISGVGTTTIAKRLNEMGIRRNQGALWDQHKAMTVINNLHYIGKIHWKQADLPEDKRIIRDGTHEPIITEETFNRAQEILRRRREGTISLNSYDYVYGGIIQCYKCGGKFQAKYNKRKTGIYRGYVCSRRNKYGTCTQSGISERNLTKLLFNTVSFSTLHDLTAKERSDVNEKDEMLKQLESSENRRSRWQLAYGDGNMPYEDFSKRMKEEMARVKELEEQLNKLPSHHEPRTSPEEAISVINNLKENWDHLEQATKKQVIQSLFNRVTIDKEGKTWTVKGVVLA